VTRSSGIVLSKRAEPLGTALGAGNPSWAPGEYSACLPRAGGNPSSLGECSARPHWTGVKSLGPGEFSALPPCAGENLWATGVPIIAPRTNGT